MIIELKEITKTYRAGEVEVPVLKGIDLDIEGGDLVALSGRSGAGKSTLMNIIGCLDVPSSGVYRLNGEEIRELDDSSMSAIRGKTIGFVFQAFHLLGRRTALENVEMPLEYQKMERRKRKARATELLERVGLSGRVKHYPAQLSGGERQRVAIARALVNEPRIVLADEPTGNLDLNAEERVLELFCELQKEMGLTLILVTHDQKVSQIARRRLTLSDGIIVEDKTFW